MLATNADRSALLAVSPQQQYVFVDPDTGIRLKPVTGIKASAYVFGPELAELCLSSKDRLVLVFDQSVPRGRERQAVYDKLDYFQSAGIYGIAYMSHACFVALSASEEVCAQAEQRLRASHLPSDRILTYAARGMPRVDALEVSG